MLAMLHEKPLVLYAVGPLLSDHARRFTRVAWADVVTVTDPESKDLLYAWKKVTVIADPAVPYRARQVVDARAGLYASCFEFLAGGSVFGYRWL